MTIQTLRRAGLAAALAAASMLSAGHAAAAAAADPAATFRAFIDAFNKGDAKGAAATHMADVAIIDEPAPHLWRGPGAFQAWADALAQGDKAGGLSDQSMRLLKTGGRTEIDGDTAYVVLQAVYTFKAKGKAMVEPGQFTAALQKDGGAWKISAWAWTSQRAHAAKPKS